MTLFRWAVLLSTIALDQSAGQKSLSYCKKIVVTNYFMALAKGSCNKNSNFFRFHRLAVGFRRFRSFHRSAVCSLSYLLLSCACYAGQFVIQVPKTVQSGSQARLVIEPKRKPKISKRNEMEEVFPWLTMDSQLVFMYFL